MDDDEGDRRFCHDLRGDVTVAAGFTQLLRAGWKTIGPSTIEHYLDHIEAALGRARGRIEAHERRNDR